MLSEFDDLREILTEAAREALPECGLGDAATVFSANCRLHEGLMVLPRLTARRYREVTTTARGERARLLAEFGRSVTHELRNRVHAARLTVELLEEMPPEAAAEERRELRTRVLRSLDRLKDAAQDVLAIAHAQQRPGQAEARVAPFSELVDEITKDTGDLVQEQRVELRLEEPLPDFAVDAARLQLVLLNLLGNAVKFADPARSERWVALRAFPTGRRDEWRIEVADNGRGKMGATLAVESEPGCGSTFSITLTAPTEESSGD